MTEDIIPSSMDAESAGQSRYRLGKWQVVFLAISIVLMAGGLILGAMAPDRPEPAQPTTEAGGDGIPGLDLSLAPVDPNTPAGETAEPVDPSAMEAWSPMIFRMGFSFFVGFAIAYAVRSFIKLAVIAAGLFLLLLFGLQYVDLVDVNWERMEQLYDQSTGWLTSQFASFSTFIQSFLPSTASAGFGAVMGFRKK